MPRTRSITPARSTSTKLGTPAGSQTLPNRVEKFALLGELLGTVAHELNAPIATALAGLENILNTESRLLDSQFRLQENFTREDARKLHEVLRKALERVVGQEPVPVQEVHGLVAKLAKKMALGAGGEVEEIARTLVRGHIDDQAPGVLGLIAKYGKGPISDVLTNWVRLLVNTKSMLLAIRRMGDLVNSLQVYTHPGKDVAVSVDVNEEIDHALLILHGKTKRGTVIRKRFSKIPEVLCVNNQLIQVWTNLLLNALQAVEEKGDIEVETGSARGWVEVRITDSGIGIPKEHLQHIFEPLFTTKGEGKGTGLGLWIAKQIVERHGGHIRAESEPGRTVVEVSLPRAQKMANC